MPFPWRLGRFVCLVWTFAVGATVLAGDEIEPGKWVEISSGVTQELIANKLKIGYPGLTAGVAVDRTNGDVFMVVCDQGVWKSSDQGRTFSRVDGGAVGGRCETGFTLNVDPAGKRLAAFMVYGGCATTHDGGATWSKWRSNHFDCGAVDWEDTGKALLTVRHESGGVLTYSIDGGLTWTDLGKGFVNGVGLFDAGTLLATKGQGILRSSDGGQNWQQVSDAKVSGATMYVFQGVGYWTTDKGVVASRDKGLTWSVLGSPVKALQGPYFGSKEGHLVVAAKEGLMETTDAGQTWTLAAPPPPGFNFGMVGPNYAWDPQRDILYASSMGKPTYKFVRGAPAPATKSQSNWPQFRGPTGLGYCDEADLPLHWSETNNVLWTAPLIGQGHASPVVWGDRVFVCTAYWPDDVADKAKTMPEHHVVCYDAANGRQLWDTKVSPGQWLRSDFRSGAGGGYAAPTPVADGQRLFVLFGSSVMAALDFEGRIVWRNEIEPHTFDVTVGSSPVLFNDNVILLCAMANKRDSRLVAFDQKTGERT